MTYHGFFSRLFISQTALAKGLIQQGLFSTICQVYQGFKQKNKA